MDPTSAEWLKARLTGGRTQRGLAKLLNVDPSAISRLLVGKRQLKLTDIEVIADYLGEPPNEVARHLGIERLLFSESHRKEREEPSVAPVFIPGEHLVGDKDLPVYASAQGGPDGMLITYDPVEWVKRPAPLLNVPRGFGVYVVGDSMEPAYFQGDMLLCHPSLPPGRGDAVLVVRRSIADGEHSCLIKVWVGGDNDRIRLKQYNPPNDSIVIPRAEVGGVHVVVGKYNRR